MFDTNEPIPLAAGLQLQIAAASVTGRDHLRAGKNNQDSFSLWRGREHLCAVVADGCGSAPHSEIGAQLGARLFTNLLAKKLEGEGAASAALSIEQQLEEVRLELLAELRPIARGLAGSGDPHALAASVRDHLLFTLVGALLGPSGATLFSLGDGVVALDAAAVALGPFPRNEPPYLGYALLPEQMHGFSEESLRFAIRGTAKAGEHGALAIGTDGALDLFASCSPAMLASDNRLFENPDALRRKLWLLAQQKPGSEGPVLRDDTTLVLLRARGCAERAA